MALDKITTNIIEDDAITAAKIVAGAVTADIPVGGVTGDKIAYFENPTDTQNLSGTYSTERMYLNDSYTLTGNVTVTGHLALGTIADADVVITQDSTERTITGSGTLEAGELLPAEKTDLTGMSGELGSVVTGGGGLTDGSSLTSLGTITSGEIGSGVTGYTGIKEYDLWRITTSYSGSANPIDQAWERQDQSHRGYLGTGMSESSGIFTFPSTGIWQITFNITFKYSGSGRFNGSRIFTSSNSGVDYVQQSEGSYGFAQAESSTTYNGGRIDALVDITDESTFRVKFASDPNNSNVEVAASSTLNYTYATFSRIGDT